MAGLRPESAIGRALSFARKQPSFKDGPSASHPPLPTIAWLFELAKLASLRVDLTAAAVSP